MAGLFERWYVGTMTAPNRLVRAATAESLCTLEGCPAAVLGDVYGALAQGGVGTIITGYGYGIAGGKPAERTLDLSTDEFEEGFRALAAAAHEGGAVIVAQLVYGGSKSKLAKDDPRLIPDAPQGAEAREGIPNTTILGPSSLVNPVTGLVPTEATAEDLRSVALTFGKAARRARSWGFDGVELHGAHGYLLSQFLTPSTNGRKDGYGGSIENRARLACECVESIRGETAADYPIFVKLNCCDAFDDPEGLRGGLSEEDSNRAAHLLVEAGASVIDVSGDWHGATGKVPEGQPYFGRFGAALARDLEAPVMVTGGWRDLSVMESFLAANPVAALGLSRPFIREPSLVSRWQEGRSEPSFCMECGICMVQGGIPCPYRK